jgi:hypothetical protein
MKRHDLVVFLSLSLAGSLLGSACGGGGDKTEPDMSACGPVTCSAITSFNPKTCQCEAADMTMTGVPIDMTQLGD